MLNHYSLVGGNPAKEIKKRFDEQTIKELLSMKWWDWEIEKISQHIPYLTKLSPQEFIKY